MRLGFELRLSLTCRCLDAGLRKRLQRPGHLTIQLDHHYPVTQPTLLDRSSTLGRNVDGFQNLQRLANFCTSKTNIGNRLWLPYQYPHNAPFDACDERNVDHSNFTVRGER